MLETQFTTAIVSNVYLAISGPEFLWNTRWCAYFSIVNTPPGGNWGRGYGALPDSFPSLVDLCLARRGRRWYGWVDESIACVTLITHL